MRRRFASGLRGNFTRGGDAETDQLRAGQHDRSCGGRADNTADYACAGDHPADGAAGELTSDGAHTYQYDAAGRLTGVDGGATARYVYDAEGRRVERAVGGQKFEEIYDLSGHIVAEMAAANGAWQRGEVFGAGRHIASYADGTTYFPHADWLGTERVRATAGDNPYEACASLWFGDGLACRFAASSLDPSPLHFTGKERDAETGLDYFGARYNASQLGRFMTPDPLGGHMENPQSLNKYVYVMDNPMTFTDPTGMYVCADDNNKCQTANDKRLASSLSQLLKSKDSDVVRAAKAYGAAGQDNGVTVKFGDPGNGRAGTTLSVLGADSSGNLKADTTITLSGKTSGASLDATVGHEGSHAADATDLVHSIQISGDGNFKIGDNITQYASEQRAYHVTDSILRSENTHEAVACGIGTCQLGNTVMRGQVTGSVDQILRDNYSSSLNHQPLTSSNPGGLIVNPLKETVPH